MLVKILIWGAVVGVIHFFIIGALYGNPWIDRIYKKAQDNEHGVRKWPVMGKYMITQFFGTQVEVYILAVGFFWLRDKIGLPGILTPLALGGLFAGIRVYPRFWNMWIQSTYPSIMLKIEFVNGVISTFVIVFGFYFLT